MALDPAEQHLRHVEKDVLIPKIMREKARERCSEQVEVIRKQHMAQGKRKPWNPVRSLCLFPARLSQVPLSDPFLQNFTRCCKDSGILMVVKCWKENSALKDCLTAYYNDPAFYEECKLEYLKEREEFRKTGVPTKKRLQRLPTSM
ncbi:COX assembly mitochondrial protein homolog [Onychomys torridus]|uniref:COX assembly mitochondrial protein homolog n=1 Tax=Onychomys torridus TaxID=38674 RepID=UPI00167F4E2A|nr:COX assembly mitochondrial protein homolog [Onychomys torridus]